MVAALLTSWVAGVAGAIVSIGITADSFIIYYERIRDSLREGKSMRQAAEIGWVATRRTILAADFVTLLAAIVLLPTPPLPEDTKITF